MISASMAQLAQVVAVDDGEMLRGADLQNLLEEPLDGDHRAGRCLCE